ncbi:hypothetical protein AWZ03_012657 [Drosophila navojoa]|uniref:Chitin-binding type-2 domain-containing protein n=1 Tax=Drosophila navojoa TaxID=7232 RepID=A0A484AZB4_DRONA|nr:hypothetical protein AWZ03_012657 [Drosophila navojoa]
MFAYQVLILPYLLLAFDLTNAQCQQSSVSVSCTAPYVLQNGACVLPAVGSSPCQSAPCPTVPGQTLPCPAQPSVPAQPLPCPNQPVAPSPAIPVQTQPLPCPNQPVTPYPIVVLPLTAAPTTTTTSTTTTSTTTTTTTTTTKRPTTQPPPAPLRQCPKGTVLIKDSCHLVYCGKGVYNDDHCVEPRCPKGTYWSGLKCVYPQPVEVAPIHLERKIIQENKGKPDIVLNNVQHLAVNASLTLPTDYRDYVEESEEAETVPPILPTSKPPTKCCTVLAPRTCQRSSKTNRWQCFNPKEQICGDICSAKKMALKPARALSWNENNIQMLTMPPNFNSDCQLHGSCPRISNRYDCSGCASGRMTSCSSYCYNYHCRSPTCAYYDQQEFCDSPQSAGSVGCRWEYGWRR